MHNIPEGIIVAAPIYAATGSRFYAVGLSAASGLSEPLGAVLALVFIKPYLTPLRLQYETPAAPSGEQSLPCRGRTACLTWTPRPGTRYMLAFVGGIMCAVCALELWPEARKCHAPISKLAVRSPPPCPGRGTSPGPQDATCGG